MNHYELLYIIPAKFTDDEVKAIAHNVQGVVQARGGQIINEDHGLGRRRLAYPIGQLRQGYYVLVNFDAEAKDVPVVSREVGLAENVIRHQIIKVNKFSDLKFLAAQEKARAEEEAKEKADVKKSKPMVRERTDYKQSEKKSDLQGERSKIIEEVVPAGVETKPESEVEVKSEEVRPVKRGPKKTAAADLAELDKKLDEILGGDF